MKTIASIVTLAIITVVGTFAVLDALDRSIFPGCKVIRQEDNTLFVKLSTSLTTGTDTACEQAERLIKSIQRQGYSVALLTPMGTWTPFPELAIYEE
jgi:hypothetical protein